MCVLMWCFFFVVKQKTAYEWRISDWSSDVCSSDLAPRLWLAIAGLLGIAAGLLTLFWPGLTAIVLLLFIAAWAITTGVMQIIGAIRMRKEIDNEWFLVAAGILSRSEEHTSELQSLMRISYAVFCLKKKTKPDDLINQI